MADWIAPKEFEFCVRTFAGQVLVYHPCSGETHNLGLDAGFLFSLILESKTPISTETLVFQAGSENLEHLDFETVDSILAALCPLGLLELAA